MSEWMQPEPWVATTHCHPKPPSPPCSAAQIEGVIDGPISWTAARRVVACVNACAGIPTPALEAAKYVYVSDHSMGEDSLETTTRELTALRAQVADLRGASDDLSDALMRDWNGSTKESSERVVATWKRLTEVLAATQPQEVQS